MLSSRPQHAAFEGSYFPTKTPSRGLKSRGENAIHPGARTAGPKGKGTVLRTPFALASAQPNKILKDGLTTNGKQLATAIRINRPLVDKTPFPNRNGQHNSQEAMGKMPKLKFLDSETGNAPTATPDMLRPSSTRKHLRAPRSASRSFETPINQGRHWEVNDVSLSSPEVEIQETIIEDDDFEEIEYMAPNTLDLPYQPPFDFELPDYKVVGPALRKLLFSAPVDDCEPPELNLSEIKPEIGPWTMLQLGELDDDDPFRQAREEASKQQSNPLEAAKSVPKPRVASSLRPSSALPMGSAASKSRTVIKPIPRPATAASSSISINPIARSTSTVLPQQRRRPPISGMASKTDTSAIKAPKPTGPRTQVARVPLTSIKPSTVAGSSRGLMRLPTSSSLHRPIAGLSKPSGLKSKGPQTAETQVLIFDQAGSPLHDDFMFDV